MSSVSFWKSRLASSKLSFRKSANPLEAALLASSDRLGSDLSGGSAAESGDLLNKLSTTNIGRNVPTERRGGRGAQLARVPALGAQQLDDGALSDRCSR